MRGKNRRRPRRRSSGGGEAPPSSGPSGSQLPPPPITEERDPWVLVPASNFFSEFSLLGFGDELKPYMRNLIYRGPSLLSPPFPPAVLTANTSLHYHKTSNLHHPNPHRTKPTRGNFLYRKPIAAPRHAPHGSIHSPGFSRHVHRALLRPDCRVPPCQDPRHSPAEPQ